MSFLSNIFGGGSAPQLGPAPQINYTPAGYNSSGGSASFSGGQYNFAPSSAASSAIGGLQNTFQQQAGALGTLAGTVQPGFSQLRTAGLDQINTQQQATTSNLRDNLSQRRVLGSSFANASLSQNDAEFAQQKANFTAQSYLSELATSQQLIQQQYQAATQSYAVGINQMNFETGVAAQLTSQASSAMANMASAQAQIDQRQAISQAQMTQQSDEANAAGAGRLFGTILGLGTGGGTTLRGGLFSSIGSGLGSFFGGGQSPTSADYGGSGVGSGGYNYLDAQA